MNRSNYAVLEGSTTFAKLMHIVHALLFAIASLMAWDYFVGIGFWVSRPQSHRTSSLLFALVLPVLAVILSRVIVSQEQYASKKVRLSATLMNGKWPLITWFTTTENN